MSHQLNRSLLGSAKRRALFKALLQEKGLDAPSMTKINRRQEAGETPLSFAQQRLWFLHQLEPDSSSYNIPAFVRLRGRLAPDVLERSLNEVIRRHEALRTTFQLIGGEPRQIIASSLTLKLDVVDLSELPATEREDAARRIALSESAYTFNLAEGPLLRASLLRLDEQEHILLLLLHHIISDDWSMSLLVQEAAALYKAFSTGAPSALPELAIQYADFAEWQREWLQGEVLEAQLTYWKKQLGGTLPTLDLPTKGPRPPVQSTRGASRSILLPARLCRALKELSQAQECTLFMTLLAAFNALLFRYAGQPDILIGTPIANRRQAETEKLIGFFVNTLVLRLDLSGDPAFRELMRQAREVTLEAYTHQDVPFERLVEALHPTRDLSRQPLFQVMFAFQNTPLHPVELPGLTWTPLEVEKKTSKFDLTLTMSEESETMMALMEYNLDLFDDSAIKRLLAHFQSLLEAVVSNPDARVSDLSFLSHAERQQMLFAWNETRTEFPQEKCLHELFEEQARNTPEALALVYQDERLTYEELNRRANQVAHYLRGHGVRPEVLVGIFAERSVEMLVGLLGILKAGGAYVPLDPAYPLERLAIMIEDAQIKVLLTQQRLVERLPSSNFHIVRLDTDWTRITSESEENPAAHVTPDNLAYLIYTSGSTGRPKAVMMPHRPLVNLLTFQVRKSSRGEALRTLQFTSLSFDVSFQEIFSTWCAGAALLLIDEESRRDARKLWQVLRERSVERLFLPYVTLQHLAEGHEAEQTASCLRQVITAGEQLKTTRATRNLFARLEGCRLENQYGPTESHVASAFLLGRETSDWPELPPIGRPISNTQLYVLDEGMQPVPLGVTGELYIGGDCLARGYLNHPAATAEKFVPHPFNEAGGARLYTTGDLARYLPDGQIEFLGRRDYQVKVRGYRVETGEVEAALRQHRSVREAVVTQKTLSDVGQLVAYVIVDSKAGLTTSEFRRHLEEKLPEYMIPSAFVFLNEFPLTPSGKIDRSALPAPDQVRPKLEETYVAPGTLIEETLARIWSRALGVERVGVHDNFFELGGHSLLATRVVSGIREAFAVEAPVRSLFESPTIAGLARQIELMKDFVGLPGELEEQADGSTALAYRTGSSAAINPCRRDRNYFPLSFAQQRLWFLHQLMPQSSAYNMPTALRLKGKLDVKALEQSLNEIIRRHEILRTSFKTIDGQPAQVIAAHRPMKLSQMDLSDMPLDQREDSVLRLSNEAAQRPFDLSTGPMLRASLLRLAEDEHVLLFTMHHIISDGWSIGVLINELGSLYKAYSTNAPSTLRELPVQYVDYAAWQRGWLKGEVLERQLGYWKQQLAGAPPVLELPAVRPRPPVQSFRGSYIPVALPANLTERLVKLSRQEGATLFMTLLAAFQTLLYRHTGQEEIVVGSPIANRNRSEIESMIGFFVNSLVLRTSMEGDPTFRELLGRVREVAFGAYEHQDLPFERLLEELQPERTARYNPLFQVVFALQNAPAESLELPGLTLSILPAEKGTEKFDLTLRLFESEDGLRGSLGYNSDIFDASTVETMLRHFRTLLQGIVSNPDRHISALPLLEEDEKRLLLATGHAIQASHRQGLCLHQLFEEQAERTPHATALVFQGEALAYGELNRRANQVAHYLRALGVGPDALVGICVERSIEMVIGLLGILKAGAAYLPLDPAYPASRLSFMLQDARASVLLVQESLVANLPQCEAKLVCLDSDWKIIGRQSDVNPLPQTSPDNLAYVIYTSGSTGQPKGVLVTHANVTRLFSATEQWVHFSRQDVWTLFHSYAFDFSVWELWGALLYGGCLVIVPYLASRSPEAFYELLVREGVTVVNQTPSAFRQLMRPDELAAERGKLRLRLIIFGGEALELQSLGPWFARHGDEHPRLVNMYGITETTVHVTYRPLRIKDMTWAVGSVIGEPIPDLSLYVLDRHLQPVPVGVAGELYVGGDGLARCYLNRPELTAERFIPHPFGEEPGARLYRTGDRARFLADGDIEYLGRLDQQVKIRGFRIELQEIEAALNEHPAIRECIVTVNEKESEAKRLIAYVVACAEQSPTVDELRRFVRQRLPDYMMPASFIFLEMLPLTPQGKIDLKALPAPDHERPLMERAFVAPRNHVEEILAGVWSDVLGVEQVGIDDNYFTLGGDSIRSIQVRAKAEGQGLRLSIPQLFQYQTIRELARSHSVTDAEPVVAVEMEPFNLISAEDRRRLPEDVEDAYPLSHLQAGLVFHSEYSPDYIIYLSSFHLRAPLDVEKLQAAVHQLVSRHAMTRTSYDLTNFGEPLQLVHHTATIPIRVEDLSHLSPDEQETWLDAWMEEEMHRRFDWASWPMMRLHIHRRSESAFQLTLSEPFLDGWSVASLITELFERYFALLAGTPLSVEPPLSASYGDFVALEREALAAEDSRRYWTSKLDDANASKLPHRAASRQTDALPKVSRVDVSISPEISEGLINLARSAGVPLKSVLLAAHCKVVGLWSGHTNVFTGLFVNGRPETTDGEKILGIFLNILPFRLSLEGATWAELVQQSFEAEREMMPFRRFPIQELQHSYGAENLFDTSFNYTHFHVYRRIQHVQGLEPLAHLGTEQTYYALTAQFNLDEAASRVTLALDYRELELCKEQVEEIADSYISVLAAMVSNPSARHESSCLLSERDQHQLLAEWNDTDVDYPQGRCFHTLFEEQAERTPHAVALVFEHHRLTYRELNQRANQLGHYLQSLGIGPEMPVAICMERSLEMVVGLLGILKAGGAYVPLDPQYPRERLSFTLEDAQVKFLLTQSRLVGIMPQGASRIVCIDDEWEAIALESTANVRSHATADNLAYLIYTSGSTGKPKGAAIEHHSTLGLMRWAGETFAESIAGVLAATSLCFDMSVFELFVPLSWGGAAVIAENALQLPTLPAAPQVTLISTVPSAMAELVRTSGVPPTVRTVTLAGEVLQHKLVHQIYEQTDIKEVWNLYGLSEDTSYSISALIERGEPESLTIGRPLPNRQSYVLDKHLQPVHVGVTGELYVSGEGLARCYVNRPELTAERFLPNPYRIEAGARMYKTGDLARYRRDGTIECLGRIDQQVKIRGYRIELGEIESVLDEHPEVKGSAVLAREDVPGEKRLVAYVVPQHEAQPSGVELRNYLKERLPKFMVPSVFVMLDEMPLTANGKVDRRAFPAPDQATSSTEESFVSPRTPVEELLCDIWAQVFHVEQVSTRDNFFDLGGHSLLATRLISRIREAFHVELSIRSLFESPTIAGLSTRVRRAMSVEQEQPAPPILPVSRNAPLPLSFAQQRLWFLDRLESGSAFYNIPIAVHLAGPLNVAALEQSFNEIIRRHEILRTSFHEVEGKPVQVIAPFVSMPLRVEDFGEIPGAEAGPAAQRFALKEAQHPFDLTESPLLRVNLLRLNDEEHILLATMHHIVSDGWSMNIFVQETTALYKAFAASESSPLAALRIQYGDFAVWQREWLRDGVLLGQLAYWKEQLAGAPTVLELPTDWPRPKVQTFRGAKYPLMLPETLGHDLKEFNRHESVTLFMTLLAAFKVLLYYYTRQTDLVVGTSIANRNRAEIEELIGFFVNTLVLRTDLSGDPTFGELLDRVREVSFGAYAHQDLPFEKLVEELQPERRSSHTPLLQVMLVLENATESELELEGLRISPLKVDSGSAKFDLTLLVQETPEGLGCLFEYNTDLFKPATITRMAEHYEMLLRHLLMKPVTRLSALTNLLDEADRQQRSVQETEYERKLHDKFKSLKRRPGN